jgi:hypothetical protein
MQKKNLFTSIKEIAWGGLSMNTDRSFNSRQVSFAIEACYYPHNEYVTKVIAKQPSVEYVGQ